MDLVGEVMQGFSLFYFMRVALLVAAPRERIIVPRCLLQAEERGLMDDR
jgi:hypothetical protein